MSIGVNHGCRSWDLQGLIAIKSEEAGGTSSMRDAADWQYLDHMEAVLVACCGSGGKGAVDACLPCWTPPPPPASLLPVSSF